jgi:hypothetical protein
MKLGLMFYNFILSIKKRIPMDKDEEKAVTKRFFKATKDFAGQIMPLPHCQRKSVERKKGIALKFYYL